MLRSRGKAAGCAILVGLATIPASLTLGGLAVVGGAHNPSLPWWHFLLWFMAPVVVPVGTVALLAEGRNRLVALAAGMGAVAVGYVLLFSWYRFDRSVSRQDLQFENMMLHQVLVYVAPDGDNLIQQFPLRPGESVESATGVRRHGAWLRVVAFSLDGLPRVETYNQFEDSLRTFPLTLTLADEQRLDERKVFDKTYTWDALRSAGGRVLIDIGGALP